MEWPENYWPKLAQYKFDFKLAQYKFDFKLAQYKFDFICIKCSDRRFM